MKKIIMLFCCICMLSTMVACKKDEEQKAHTAITNIPSTKGKIMMNAWCGTGVDSWLNAFDDSNLPIISEYQWIKYTPFE